MRYSLLAFLLACSVATAEWTPPDSPDPDKILDEARADAHNGNHQDALLKHIWFHHNALKYERSLYGVRLSFALSDWLALGSSYPPALQALKDVRDKAGLEVQNGINYHDFFHDYQSINENLGEEEKTVQLFSWLDTHQPERAKTVYQVAQPSLIRAQKYELCGKYIDPDNEYPQYVKHFKSMLEFAKDSRYDKRAEDFAYNNFSNDVSTLVALLAVNNRKEEAKQITEKAMLEWNDEGFAAELSAALEGKMPAPWP
jgi:hypothetical protein